MSDDSRETIRLIQHNSDDPGEFICLNQHDSDDPRESIPLNLSSDDPCESIRLNQHDSDDRPESIHLKFKNNNPRESIRLDQYYSDLGYCRKSRCRKDITFTTSAVGLIELGNVVYKKLCEISPKFAECVSSSMFMYYVAQLHYMRLCCLEWKVAKPDADDLHMKNIILRNKWIVPQLLADYFNSIGSFRDSTGIPAQHREIVFPCADDLEGINGFFGRVDSNTHFHYENRISPGVAAKRIVEDLIFTLHPSRRLQGGYWDLPGTLVPAEKNARGPTGNLLGWSLATALTPVQVNVLKDCGVSCNEGKTTFLHCTRFCHNNQLMRYISARLNELRGRVKCEERLSTVPMGSIAQHDFQLVGTHYSLPRTSVYGDISTYNCGFAPLHLHQELFAHVFRFRIVRRKMLQAGGISVNPWCCYHFNTYREVPESWYLTSNSYFKFGGIKTWNTGLYKTPPADLRIFLNSLMVKTLIQ